jgi:mannose-1-phosphate guanylyltransferase
LLDFLPDRGFSTLVDGLRAALAAGRVVTGLQLAGFWDDLGTPQAIWKLHRALIAAPPEGLTHLAPSSPLVLAQEAAVQPGAWVSGFAVLGQGARVEAGAWLKDSILLPGARLTAGARVRNAILGDGFIAQGEIVGGAHA